MYSELFHWGFIHVRSYGLMLAIAFLVGTWLGLKEARRRGLDEEKLTTVILVSLVSAVIGARVLYVIEHLDEFREWASVLALWQGGLTLYGGIVGGTLAGLWTAKRLGLPMWSAADALVPSLALGTLFGRIGCFLNGCCYGRPTSLPWGIVYPPQSFAGIEFGQTPIHPAQLYFSAAGLGMFVALWRTRKRIHTPGVMFWTFIVLFTLTRAVLDFTRAYEPGSVIAGIGALDVTESQVISLSLGLLGLLMILRLRRAAATATAPVPAQ